MDVNVEEVVWPSYYPSPVLEHVFFKLKFRRHSDRQDVCFHLNKPEGGHQRQAIITTTLHLHIGIVLCL